MKSFILISVFQLFAVGGIFAADAPKIVVQQFLETYDGSLWDLKVAFTYAAGLYIDKLSKEDKESLLAEFKIKPQSGKNEAMSKWFNGQYKVVEIKDEKIVDKYATVTAVLKEKKTGNNVSVEYKLVNSEDKWLIYANGNPGDDGIALQKETLAIYEKMESDYGFSGVKEFIRRTMINKENPATVNAELKKKNPK